MLHAIPARQKIIVMAAVMSGLFLAALDQTIISTALGRIIEDFQAFNELSWIVTAYLLTSTITVPISGKLSDIFGRRNLLLVGVGVFIVASLLSGMAQNISQLIAFRALQGVGGGILFANAFTIIGDLFPPRERGKWQGIVGAVFGLASVAGPLLGGYLTDPHNILGLTTNWRWTFWINVPIGLIAFALIAWQCPNFKHPRRAKIDFAGAFTLAGFLTSIVLAAENTEQLFRGLLESTGWSAGLLKSIFIAATVIFLGLFIAIERRASEPILPLHLFRSSIFRVTMTAVFFMGLAFLGSILYLSQFAMQVLGFNATQTGLALMPLIFALSATSAIGGRVVSNTGKYKKLMLAASIIAAVGVLSLATLSASSSYLDVALRMVVCGIGLGLLMPTYNVVVQNDFAQKELGVVTSSVQLFRSLGSTIGTALLGGLLTAGVATSVPSISETAYIKSLQSNPQSAEIVSKFDANTALQLNTPDMTNKVRDGFNKGIEAQTAQLPPEARTRASEQATTNFSNSQNEFSTKVKEAFAGSLRTVFLYAAGAMFIAFLITLMLKEIPLRNDTEHEAPGV
jgi:EmrB/QacA subfamily drug resistance transporter